MSHFITPNFALHLTVRCNSVEIFKPQVCDPCSQPLSPFKTLQSSFLLPCSCCFMEFSSQNLHTNQNCEKHTGTMSIQGESQQNWQMGNSYWQCTMAKHVDLKPFARDKKTTFLSSYRRSQYLSMKRPQVLNKNSFFNKKCQLIEAPQVLLSSVRLITPNPYPHEVKQLQFTFRLGTLAIVHRKGREAQYQALIFQRKTNNTRLLESNTLLLYCKGE